MINYSANIAGAINHRTQKAGFYLATLLGCEGSALRAMADIVNDFSQRIPDYLDSDSIKELKKHYQPDLYLLYRSRYLSQHCRFQSPLFNKIQRLKDEGLFTRDQAVLAIVSLANIYNWWYQSDEELRILSEQFKEGRYVPPILDTSEEIYKSAHHPGPNSLYETLSSEKSNIYQYERDRGWPVIDIDTIKRGLDYFKSLVLGKEDVRVHNLPHSVEELVYQFRRVRNSDPASQMRSAIVNPRPENYMMSSRGNNYNSDPQFREYISRIGGPAKIVTALGSLFRYDSKYWDINHPDLVDINKLPFVHKFRDFDFYCIGFGKKNGGKPRVFMYTSPQNSMIQNVASRIIRRFQEQNPYQAYIDQSRGQKQLYDSGDKIGLDSTEYSDHQTITLLQWILEIYGFEEFAIPLAWQLHLPIYVDDGPDGNPIFLQPANGSEAGGKLDVALINDAAQIIIYLHWYVSHEESASYTCGDDWTQYFHGPVSKRAFLTLHSLACSFNQIVNPDKTEWEQRDGFIGFCRMKSTVDEHGLRRPASGIPASSWLKQPDGLRDISQVLQYMDRSGQLEVLFPSKESKQELVERLFDLWREDLEDAWLSLVDTNDEHVTSLTERFENSKKIPLDIGGLAMDPSQYSYKAIIESAINGLDKLILDYSYQPTSIATFIDRRGIPGIFADYISTFVTTPLENLIALMVELKSIYDNFKSSHLYNHSDLKKVMHELSTLLLDYAANSDGISRKSTKDRHTTDRDPDVFLDNISLKFSENSIISRDINTANMCLLDCLMANPRLSTAGSLKAFCAVTYDLQSLMKSGKISYYSGVGYQADEFYPSLSLSQDGQAYRVRLWNVDDYVDKRTIGGRYLPLTEIKDIEVRNFVEGCRKLVDRGYYSQLVGSAQRVVLEKVKEAVRSKILSNQKKRSEQRPIDEIMEEIDLTEDMI